MNMREKAFEAGHAYYQWNYFDFKTEPDLAPMRAHKNRWNDLLKKYFPDQMKE